MMNDLTENNKSTLENSWPYAKFQINCDEASSFVQTYLFTLIYFGGSLLNILCVIVFRKILYPKIDKAKENKNSIFEIFFFKSITDSMLFISNTFSLLYFCQSCESKDSWVMQVWYIVINDYFTRVTQGLSMCLEIIATFDLLLSINTSLKNCLSIFKYKNFNRLSMTMGLMFCAGFYCYIIFENEIVPNISNGTLIYKIQNTIFYSSTLRNILYATHSVLRDVIGMIILMTLSILIIKSIQNLIKNKKYLLKNIENDSIKKLIKYKRRTIQMIFVTNLINIILHAPICIYTFQPNYLTSISCFRELTRTLLKISYLMGFFIYFTFNKKFRQVMFKVFIIEKIKNKV